MRRRTDKPPAPESEIRRLRHMRNEWRQSAERWRFYFVIAATSCAFLLVALGMAGVTLLRTKPDRSDQPQPLHDFAGYHREVADVTPNHLLSAIYLKGGSGTVWAKGEKRAAVISAAHCFPHWPIGAKAEGGNVKGKEFTLIVEDIDYAHDLAYLTMPAEFAIGVSNVVSELPDYGSDKQAVGFPQCKGPVFKHLENEVQTDGRKWICTVRDGQFWAGDSGGGMFLVGCADDDNQDGLLAGVIHAQGADNFGRRVNFGSPQQPTGRMMYCVPHAHLLAFCEKQTRKETWECGNGFCCPRKRRGQPQPGPGPGPRSNPAPAPNPKGTPDWLKPNVPITVPPPDDLGTPAPDPAEKTPAPDPAPPAKPKRPTPPHPEKPQANALPKPYDGNGRPPAGLRTPHQRSHWISVLLQMIDATGNGGSNVDLTGLQQKIAMLEQELADLKKCELVPAPIPDVVSLVNTAVANAIAGLPKPKDGHDGAVDPGALQKAVDQAVQSAVAALPKPQDGAAGKAGPAGAAGGLGPPGPPGPAGVVTVNVIDLASGKKTTYRDQPSGTTINVKTNRFPVPPPSIPAVPK